MMPYLHGYIKQVHVPKAYLDAINIMNIVKHEQNLFDLIWFHPTTQYLFHFIPDNLNKTKTNNNFQACLVYII